MRQCLYVFILMFGVCSQAYSNTTCPFVQIIGSGSVCNAGSYQLSAVAEDANGNQTFGAYTWLDDHGAFVSSNSFITTPYLKVGQSVGYTVYADFDGCDTQEIPVTVVVVGPPSPPVVHGAERCGPGSVQLSVEIVSGTTYEWMYNGQPLAQSGLDYVDNGSTLTINNVSSTTSAFALRATFLSHPCVSAPMDVTATITIKPFPSITFGSIPATSCINGSGISLSATPSGGTWSGPGVSGSTFSPASAGSGAKTITYTYTSPTTQCTSALTRTITVSPGIGLSPQIFCPDNPAARLFATPSGGTWSGTYTTTDGFYDAETASHTSGTLNVTYTVTVNGCTDSKTTTVGFSTPNPLPEYQFTIGDGVISCGGTSVFLAVNHDEDPNTPGQQTNNDDIAQGFLWFKDGVMIRNENGTAYTDASYNTPVTTVSATYVAIAELSFGCARSAATSVEIIDIIPPTVPDGYNCSTGGGEISIAPLENGYTYEWSDNDGPIGHTSVGSVSYSLTNGGTTLQIDGVQGATNHTVFVRKVSTTHSQCISDQTITHLIYRIPPVVSIGSGVPDPVCHNAGPIPLNIGSPAGGTWYIDNVVLNPQTNLDIEESQIAYGDHNLRYSYTDQYGCINSATDPFRVIDPVPDFYGGTFPAKYEQTLLIQLIAPSFPNYPQQTFNWYSDQVGGPRLATSNSFTTDVILTQRKYYVSATFSTNHECETFRAEAIIEVTGPNNHNYVREEVLLDDYTVEGDIAGLAEDKKTVTTSYIDGLGRPMETVVTRGSQDHKDVVAPSFYDAFSRETVKVLPITNGNTGDYQNLLKADGAYLTVGDQFYTSLPGPHAVVRDAKPFTTTTYDASPLNRVKTRIAPGAAIRAAGKSVSTTYTSNSGSSAPSNVYLFKFNSDDSSISLGQGRAAYYDVNELSKVITTDEDDHQTLEFTDKRGRMVCKMVQLNSTTYASTYYIYDDFGNLFTVLPPEAIVQLESHH